MTAFLIAASLMLFAFWFIKGIEFTAPTNNSYSVIDLPVTDTAFGGFFSHVQTEDLMPYYKYRKAQDSFKRIEQIRNLKNKGLVGEGFSSGGIGIFAIPKKSSLEVSLPLRDSGDPILKTLIDSLDKVHTNPVTKKSLNSNELIQRSINARLNYRRDSINKELEKEKLYYFALDGYELKNYDTKFYIEGDNYNLAYVKWDTTKSANQFAKTGHYESKQIKVRYASERKRILIPITETPFKVLKFVIWTFAFLTGALILYFFVGLPIRLLINISRGRAFIEKNIQILNQISLAAFIIPLLTIISPYIFRLLFWKIIPDDFKIEPLMNKISDNIFVIMMGLVAFLIAKAFKKGYNLQHEQDLTI